MPYPGVPDEKTEDMESCVRQVMERDDVDKESAIKICRDSIMGFKVEIVQDPTEINAVLGGKYLPGELLRFENMELAKAEVNANRDELVDADITALAETLPLMPLDDEHNQDAVVGLFTAARNEGGRLLTDGIIYARRFPGIAEDVIEGKRRPSIEAHADMAVCSLCGGEFARFSDYCEHLRDKHGSGAVRRFRGIRAVGGGVVQYPAGSTAAFDLKAVYMVASHQEQRPNVEAGEPPDDEQEGVDMDKIEEIQAELDKALEEIQRLETERDEAVEAKTNLESANTELQERVDELTAKVEEHDQALQAERERNADLLEANRRAVLASIYDEDAFNEHKDTIMAMSDEAVQLMASLKPPKTTPPKQPVANLDEANDDDVLTL